MTFDEMIKRLNLKKGVVALPTKMTTKEKEFIFFKTITDSDIETWQKFSQNGLVPKDKVLKVSIGFVDDFVLFDNVETNEIEEDEFIKTKRYLRAMGWLDE